MNRSHDREIDRLLLGYALSRNYHRTVEAISSESENLKIVDENGLTVSPFDINQLPEEYTRIFGYSLEAIVETFVKVKYCDIATDQANPALLNIANRLRSLQTEFDLMLQVVDTSNSQYPNFDHQFNKVKILQSLNRSTPSQRPIKRATNLGFNNRKKVEHPLQNFSNANIKEGNLDRITYNFSEKEYVHSQVYQAAKQVFPQALTTIITDSQPTSSNIERKDDNFAQVLATAINSKRHIHQTEPDTNVKEPTISNPASISTATNQADISEQDINAILASLFENDHVEKNLRENFIDPIHQNLLDNFDDNSFNHRQKSLTTGHSQIDSDSTSCMGPTLETPEKLLPVVRPNTKSNVKIIKIPCDQVKRSVLVRLKKTKHKE